MNILKCHEKSIILNEHFFGNNYHQCCQLLANVFRQNELPQTISSNLLSRKKVLIAK
jgi:hypothetical protein